MRRTAGVIVIGAACALLGIAGAASAQAATATEFGASASEHGYAPAIVAGAYKKLGKASADATTEYASANVAGIVAGAFKG
ncbi:hypothetical protein [Actinocrispum wychmicini]|uniref:Small secreted protein n=1 Tax=Actinocrispum wychmicini TaxID=1213861 RepID=A0A4R2JXF9_9PSEU|nr:hypothetical protein [Actinocrispum wychmicini]TCO62088.1 hypothetical protein EV192_102225 [Actinocrispum wychmicini]